MRFFDEKLSHEDNVANPPAYFSEQVTMYNVLNGTFPDKLNWMLMLTGL
jgi:hypothetical protein